MDYTYRVFTSRTKPTQPTKQLPKPNPRSVQPLPLGFVPFVSASADVQEPLWQRIIHFATEADYEYTADDLKPCTRTRKYAVNEIETISLAQLRLNNALVSKGFYVRYHSRLRLLKVVSDATLEFDQTFPLPRRISPHRHPHPPIRPRYPRSTRPSLACPHSHLLF